MDTMQQASADEALAAQLEITFDGRRYAYRQYRYDYFADAANFARANHGRPDFVPDAGFVPHWSAPFHPTEEDMQRMQPYGISYARGHYYYGNYRYDQLEYAIAYAALRAGSKQSVPER